MADGKLQPYRSWPRLGREGNAFFGRLGLGWNFQRKVGSLLYLAKTNLIIVLLGMWHCGFFSFLCSESPMNAFSVSGVKAFRKPKLVFPVEVIFSSGMMMDEQF